MSDEEQKLADLRRQICEGIERVRRSIERARWLLSRNIASTTDALARGLPRRVQKQEESKKTG